jgi:hypothetical protein
MSCVRRLAGPDVAAARSRLRRFCRIAWLVKDTTLLAAARATGDPAGGTPFALQDFMRILRSLWLLAPLALTACEGSFASTLALGPPVPPSPPNCPLEFARIDPQVAQTQWQQVGIVCLSGGYSSDPTEAYGPGPLRDDLQANACSLGGQMVTPLDQCWNAAVRLSGIKYGVFRARQANPSQSVASGQSVPAAPPGTAPQGAVPPPPMPPPEVICAEAKSYETRADAADGAVRDALRRIAASKAAQCEQARATANK